MNNINGTTDLGKIKNGERPPLWGDVIECHTLGRYTLVEFFATYQKITRKEFAIYVDGQFTDEFAPTLETAIVHAIALGRNYPKRSQRGEAACRLLELDAVPAKRRQEALSWDNDGIHVTDSQGSSWKYTRLDDQVAIETSGASMGWLLFLLRDMKNDGWSLVFRDYGHSFFVKDD